MLHKENCVISYKLVSFEVMPKNSENAESASPSKKVIRLPPKRGQIKAKIMTQIMRKVEEAGRALSGKGMEDEEEAHPSHPHEDRF